VGGGGNNVHASFSAGTPIEMLFLVPVTSQRVLLIGPLPSREIHAQISPALPSIALPSAALPMDAGTPAIDWEADAHRTAEAIWGHLNKGKK
jgi:hypothetical protein